MSSDCHLVSVGAGRDVGMVYLKGGTGLPMTRIGEGRLKSYESSLDGRGSANVAY